VRRLTRTCDEPGRHAVAADDRRSLRVDAQRLQQQQQQQRDEATPSSRRDPA